MAAAVVGVVFEEVARTGVAVEVCAVDVSLRRQDVISDSDRLGRTVGAMEKNTKREEECI